MIKGCSARCPLCGSKCDQVGEHARHRCAHHLFPAFHGWMDRQNGHPSFHYCKSKEAFEGTYQCNDGEWRPLEVFLRENHEAWLPFQQEEDTSSAEDLGLLKAAWVNCRVPLLEYFKPMVDEMPSEWDAYHEPERALKLEKLRQAKDVIRKIREKKFVPNLSNDGETGRKSGSNAFGYRSPVLKTRGNTVEPQNIQAAKQTI